MPHPLPKEVRSAVTRFSRELRGFQKDAAGRELVAGLQRFSRAGGRTRSDLEQTPLALNEWLLRLPQELLEVEDSGWLQLEKLDLQDAHLALADGLQVLSAGIRAALLSPKPVSKDYAARLLRVAFGDDAASLALRRPLLDRKFPGIPPLGPEPEFLPGLKELPEISRLVREGVIRDLIRRFGECGYAAQLERDWINAVQPFGRVTQLTASSRCGGGALTIGFAGFGAQPPDPSRVADIVVSLPTRSGCEHVRLRQIAPHFFDPRGWRDSGTLTVTLPAEVSAGCIGFFTLPPPVSGSGPCEAGSLVGAAGELREVLVREFGPAYGVLHTQTILDAAAAAEAGRHRPLPCAACQADRLNHMEAGPAVIDAFRAIEIGPIFPRNTLTITWSVYNATSVSIVPKAVPGSESAHELPPIPGPIGPMGRVVLQIPCTRRWEAEYEIRASNGNGCGPNPVTATIRVRSGFSHYRLGCGMADITDRRPGLGMQGFAYQNQRTSGKVHLPQFARAFYIGENSAAPDRKFLVIVVADIWSCSEPLKNAVLARLNGSRRATVFTQDNLMICGTHTHAGPGGYFHYPLYNLTCGGYDEQVLDTMAAGIAQAVDAAALRAVPGRLYVTRGEVKDCGGNRSFDAYKNNIEFQRGATQADWTDRWMTLLKFIEDVDNLGTKRPLGCLNWYAIHPTSLGMFNDQISGDNKGWASKLMEDKLNPQTAGGAPFVAAFANASAGDISGNVTVDLRGNVTSRMPIGGKDPGSTVIPSKRVFPPTFTQDVQILEELGRKQADVAIDLFGKATEEITGPLAAHTVFIDMSNVPIAALPGQRTWPGAMGVSFGSGSSEDSLAYATLDLPLLGVTDIDPAIPEGISQTEWAIAAAEFWTHAILTLGPVGLTLSALFASGAKISVAVYAPLLVATARSLLSPLARTYALSRLAAVQIEDQLPRPQADAGEDGSWQFIIPAAIDLPPDYVAGHGAKPIMFPVGQTGLVYTPGPSGNPPERRLSCPLVPNVIPMQLLRIGQVAIPAVPGEITATAGRRLAATVLTAFGSTVRYAPICSYANSYSGYVTTPEEYNAQHYEGASTLYGPHTLAAYQQTFQGLTARLTGASTTAIAGESAPFVVRAFHRKP